MIAGAEVFLDTNILLYAALGGGSRLMPAAGVPAGPFARTPRVVEPTPAAPAANTPNTAQTVQ